MIYLNALFQYLNLGKPRIEYSNKLQNETLKTVEYILNIRDDIYNFCEVLIIKNAFKSDLLQLSKVPMVLVSQYWKTFWDLSFCVRFFTDRESKVRAGPTNQNIFRLKISTILVTPPRAYKNGLINFQNGHAYWEMRKTKAKTQ